MMLFALPTRTHHARPSAGFTLIELVVVMVILAIVMAFVGRALLDGFTGATKTQTEAITSQATAEAIDTIRADVQAALSSDRDRTKIRDDFKFESALKGEPVTSDDPADGGRTLEIQDITKASPTLLAFQIEVNAENPGSECVQYELMGGSTFSLKRVQSESRGCGEGQKRTVLKPMRAIDGRTFDKVFTYNLLSDACTLEAEPRETVGGAELNRIVSVNVLLGAAATRGRSVSTDGRQTVISVRSRETLEYRRALGCG